jgi:hypothetical protein
LVYRGDLWNDDTRTLESLGVENGSSVIQLIITSHAKLAPSDMSGEDESEELVKRAPLDLQFVVVGSPRLGCSARRICLTFDDPAVTYLSAVRTALACRLSAESSSTLSPDQLLLYDTDGVPLVVNENADSASHTLEGFRFEALELCFVVVITADAAESEREASQRSVSAPKGGRGRGSEVRSAFEDRVMAGLRASHHDGLRTHRFAVAAAAADGHTAGKSSGIGLPGGGSESAQSRGALAAALYVAKSERLSPVQRDRILGRLWALSKCAPVVRALHQLFSANKQLDFFGAAAIGAGFVAVLSAVPGAPDSERLLQAPKLLSLLASSASDSVVSWQLPSSSRAPFEVKSLKDAATFPPYKDARLSDPVVGPGGRVYSRSAIQAGN